MADPPAPSQLGAARASSKRRRSGTLAILAVVAVLALVFVVQNHNSVSLSYLGAHFSAPEWLMLLVFLALGALIGMVIGRRRTSR